RVGQWQEHAPQHPRRHGGAVRGSRGGRRAPRRGNGRRRAHGLSPQCPRLHLAADGAEPPALPQRSRERRAADAARGRLAEAALGTLDRAARARRADRPSRATAGQALGRRTARWSGDILAGVYKQRAWSGCARATEPAILLADEPTGELDTTTAHEVFEL